MPLFANFPASIIPQVSGLNYLANFLSAAEEKNLLEQIDAQNWLPDLQRRVQHYGYKYDYKARLVSAKSYLGELPNWLQIYADKLVQAGHFATTPDQAIVNEYQVGQGISAHIDCVPCFAETIASISLGSTCEMNFQAVATGEKATLLLEPRASLVLSGDARYKWTHAIAARRTDIIAGQKIVRQRRVSITFRKVII